MVGSSEHSSLWARHSPELVSAAHWWHRRRRHSPTQRILWPRRVPIARAGAGRQGGTVRPKIHRHVMSRCPAVSLDLVQSRLLAGGPWPGSGQPPLPTGRQCQLASTRASFLPRKLHAVGIKMSVEMRACPYRRPGWRSPGLVCDRARPISVQNTNRAGPSLSGAFFKGVPIWHGRWYLAGTLRLAAAPARVPGKGREGRGGLEAHACSESEGCSWRGLTACGCI